MRLDELNEATYHGKDEKLEKLLDAVASAMPFVGYESANSEKYVEELNKAFITVAGMDWYDWKERR